MPPSLQPAVDMSAPSFIRDPPPPSKQSLNPHINYPNTPSPIQCFIAEVDRELGKIEDQLSQVYHIRDRPIRTEDNDPRIIDLHIAGCRNISPIARLRRGLSQRLLVTEFDKWEQASYGTSAVKKQASCSALEPGRKLGHITEFLKFNEHRFRNYSAARNGIQHGIKLLVCETLLSGAGISAIFIFEYSRLRSIKFRDLRGLKDAIKDATKIKKLAHQKADWIDCCQKSYDGREKILNISTISPSPLRAIRPRRSKQSQQSSASRIPSLRPLPNSPPIDSAVEYDDIDTNDTSEVAVDNSAYPTDSDAKEPGNITPSRRIHY